MTQLGKVNPLALEEFAALEERHAFLTSQLEDLKKTRRDLMLGGQGGRRAGGADVLLRLRGRGPEFEQIFARVFPGGEGRLVLTDPTTC